MPQQQRWQKNNASKQMPANEMVRVRFEKQVATPFCYISVEVDPLEKLKHVQP